MKKENQHETMTYKQRCMKSEVFFTASKPYKCFLNTYVLSNLKLFFHSKMSNLSKTTYIHYRPENSSWPSNARKSMINMTAIQQWT